MLSDLSHLIQLGGIGGSLAFLYLGYKLLRVELSHKTAAGNRSAPNPEALGTIKSFLRTSLVFFIIGVAAELLLGSRAQLVFAVLDNFIRNEVSRVALDYWSFEPSTNNILFQLSSIRFDQETHILNADRDNYDIIVAVRQMTATPNTTGEYPVFFGPYPYPLQTNERETAPIDPEKLKLLGNKCIKLVVFGIAKGTFDPQLSPQSFVPANYPTNLKVFSSAFGGPEGSGC